MDAESRSLVTNPAVRVMGWIPTLEESMIVLERSTSQKIGEKCFKG